MNECLNSPCFNGGTCINNAGSFTCNCTDGWEGNECSESKYRDKTYRTVFSLLTKNVLNILWNHFMSWFYDQYWSPCQNNICTSMKSWDAKIRQNELNIYPGFLDSTVQFTKEFQNDKMFSFWSLNVLNKKL